MSSPYQPEPMLEMYLYECGHLLEQLEQTVLDCEKTASYSSSQIQDIFRCMHTIKGSSAMMLFNHIATLCHSMEDLFFFLRETEPRLDDWGELSELLLCGIDFIKLEYTKIRNGDEPDGQTDDLVRNIGIYLDGLKTRFSTGKEPAAAQKPSQPQQFYILPDKNASDRTYMVRLSFEEGAEMENVRAYAVVHHLKDSGQVIRFEPSDILDSDGSAAVIRESGFQLWIRTGKNLEELRLLLEPTLFLKELSVEEAPECTGGETEARMEAVGSAELATADPTIPGDGTPKPIVPHVPNPSGGRPETEGAAPVSASGGASSKGGLISVSVEKLDRLLDLVGEMIIAEAMVVENPDLKDLTLPNFTKASRQLRKISGELQDQVMSIRMVPLATTFHKMNRIVRDMSKKLGKDVALKLIGEETEVDKNIIEHLSDPLMHLIRNSIDHGIEMPEDRRSAGKPALGTVTLEAANRGSEVHVLIRDDGRGLDRERILRRAKENGLLSKPESECSDKEIYGMIFLPGFSTKEAVTEFSGRGVGMDVVARNLEAVGGSIQVDSVPGKGSCITLKIPLTLAIIEGMNIGVGLSRYTIPTASIRESFRPREGEVFRDPEGSEMIMVRGQCYPVLRLHEFFKADTRITSPSEGILIMIEHDGYQVCLLADELLGQQQVIVKALPAYIRLKRRIGGLAGCTLLGDGSINLILDVPGLLQAWKDTAS
ncbi:chemotaxis protein CheW [Gorillibacterium sp. sgz5001074]|uniref:chemotaxis protein CheW n=1 Tax=Gorillibacterium sp. sgz5001074 TaxID=3446695 RepID=UPI003F669902